ncbi:hypothetical protein EE612_041650 [Oryza sativa]|nr:hypothetical protein EE612_041650 [Oryza sativa]
MLAYDVTKNTVPLLLELLGVGAHHSPQQIHLRQAREVVFQVEASVLISVAGGELHEQLVPAFSPERRLPAHGAAQDVVGEGAEQLPHVDGGARGRRLVELGDGDAHLLLAATAERLDLLGAEQVGGDELPRLAPVVAVGGEGDVGGAIGEDVGDGGARPRREHVVVSPEDGLGGARGRDDEVAHLAELEEHEAVGGVLLGEVAEGDVRVGADEVHVAYHRQPRRRRWQDIIVALARRR